MDSGLAAEPVIGPRFARTRWRRPGMTPKLITRISYEKAQDMTISKLELPEWGAAPMIDWSPLGRIGDAIEASRHRGRIRDAVEGARDANGHVSLARLGENL